MSTYHPDIREAVIKNREKETALWIAQAIPACDGGWYASIYSVLDGVIWQPLATWAGHEFAERLAESVLGEYRAGTLDLIRYDPRVGDLG